MTETQTLTFHLACRVWWETDNDLRFRVDGGGWLTGPAAYALLTGWFTPAQTTAMLAELASEAWASQAAGAETGSAYLTAVTA